MTFQLFEDVVLTTDIPEHDLYEGDIGTAVERHVVSDKEAGYSVEFFDMTGQTVAVVTIAESCLRSPQATDRPAVRRELSHAS